MSIRIVVEVNESPTEPTPLDQLDTALTAVRSWADDLGVYGRAKVSMRQGQLRIDFGRVDFEGGDDGGDSS